MELATTAKLKEFNKSLENIDKLLESQQWEDACKQAKKSEKLINVHFREFNKREPYYDWGQIKKVLKIIPKQFCKS